MIITFELCRNNKPVGVFGLEKYIEKYFMSGFSEETMRGICFNEFYMSEIERIMPHCGYDVKIVEVE